MQTYDDPEETDNYLLPDRPSRLPDQDTFGHRQYVETLVEIVRNVEPPWQIGIFGKWGTGKSTILGELERKLEPDQDIVVVEFDAWRHAEESVRTELLLTIDRQLGEKLDVESSGNLENQEGLLGEERITRQLYDVEEAYDPIDSQPPEWLPNILTAGPRRIRAYRGLSARFGGIKLAVLTIVLLLGAAGFLRYVLQIPIAIASVFGVIVALTPYLIQKFNETEATQRRLANPRKEWSGAYERIFDELLGKLENSKERLVIAIDNLDRCDSEVVYDVLVSLKTFMGKDPCVYVVPCDHDALRKQVASIEDDETREWDENEFLRKFFQTSLRIPPFESRYMEQFAASQQDRLVDEHGLDDRVANVLAARQSPTPRRIKHGLNRVVTLKLLGEHLEEAELLSEGQISNNQCYLAKVVVLEEDFPEFFRVIRDDEQRLEEASKYIEGEIEAGELSDALRQLLDPEMATGQTTGLVEFLEDTKHHVVDNPRPFFFLSDPEYSEILTDLLGFRKDLREHDVPAVQGELQQLPDDAEIDPYLTVLDDTIRRDWSDPGRLWNVVSTAVEAFPVIESELKPEFADVLVSGLQAEAVETRFRELDAPGILAIAATLTDSSDRRFSYARYIDTLVEDGRFRASQFEAFVTHTEAIWTGQRPEVFVPPEPDRLDRVRETLRVLAEEQPSENGDQPMAAALRALAGRSETAERLLDDDTLPVVVDTLLEAHTESSPILEAFLGVDQYASPDQRSRVLESILDDTSLEDPEAVDELVLLLRKFSTPGAVESRIFSEDAAEQLFRNLEPIVTDLPIDELQLVEFPIKFYADFSAETKEEIRNLIVDIIGDPDNHDISSIVDWVADHESGVLAERDVAEAYLDGIPEEFNDVDTVLTAVGQIGVENDDLIADRVLLILEEHDRGEFLDLAFRIFETYHEWLEGIQEDMVAEALRVSASASPEAQRRPLQAVGTVVEGLGEEQRDRFVDRLQSLIYEPGMPAAHEVFANVLSEIQDDITADELRSFVGSADERMAEELRANRLPNPELVAFVYSHLADNEYTHPDDREAIIEALCDRLVAFEIDSEADEERQERLIELLIDLPTYADMQDRVLNAINTHRESVAGLVPNEAMLADLETELQGGGGE